jgi:hypothetical protein
MNNLLNDWERIKENRREISPARVSPSTIESLLYSQTIQCSKDALYLPFVFSYLYTYSIEQPQLTNYIPNF